MKYSNNVKFYVNVIVDEYIDINGNKKYRTEWREYGSDLNIGSVAKPLNKTIIEFKWQKPNSLTKWFN